MEFDPLNRFIAANVHIARLWAEAPTGGHGQRGVPAFLVACCQRSAAIALGLLERFLAPTASHHKICLGIGSSFADPGGQVEWHDRVLGQATALHEKNMELLRYGEQLAQVGLGLLMNGGEVRAPMAHLHHPHAAALPIKHLGGSLLEHRLGHGGRAGRKIKRACRHRWWRHPRPQWRHSQQCVADR